MYLWVVLALSLALNARFTYVLWAGQRQNLQDAFLAYNEMVATALQASLPLETALAQTDARGQQQALVQALGSLHESMRHWWHLTYLRPYSGPLLGAVNRALTDALRQVTAALAAGPPPALRPELADAARQLGRLLASIPREVHAEGDLARALRLNPQLY